MSPGWLWALAASACVGLVSVPLLSVTGIRLLALEPDQSGRIPVVISGSAGAVAGAAGGLAAFRAGSGWWLAGSVAWAVFLVAAAICDGRLQRVPTRLVWAGATATVVGLLVGCAGTGQWRVLVVSAAASGAAGLILLACWRFAGAGFGDVRLAFLGGLCLGHTHYAALPLAAIVFAVVLGVQVAILYARTRDRHAMLPYGPAMAAAFLVASVA